MELRPLGKTGVELPVIGLGTWEYSGGVEPLRRGVELGAWLIDTAEMYRTEDVVGDAIGGIREQVFVASKVSGSHLRYQEVMQAADKSLGLLRVDCMDLYQIHWPNSRVPIAETMGAMEDLVDAGKVRYIGVSNFSASQLQEAQRAMRKHPIASNQVLYNLVDREIEEDLLPYCQRNNVTIIAYSPLDRGGLAVRPRLRRRHATEALQRVTSETGKTLAQVSLNWCLSRPGVVAIPKANRIQHVEENCAAAEWSLTPEQVRLLDESFA